MSDVKTIRRVPLQFDFEKRWHSEVYPRFFESAKLQEALIDLLEDYEDMLDDLSETMDGFNVIGDTEAEIAIMRLKARTRFRQLKWLKKAFCNHDMENFILTLAEVLYPNLKFHVQRQELGDWEPESVVTDEDRTLVFDFKNHDTLSAMGSLALAGDPWAQKDRNALIEMVEFLNRRRQIHSDVLSKLMAKKNEADGKGHVMPIRESVMIPE